MKVLIISVFCTFITTLIFSQKHVELLKSQIPKRFETYDRLRYFKSLKCDSVVGNFCSSKKFNHIVDKNRLSDKNGICVKYLDDKVLADSLYGYGVLFGGLMKEMGDSCIKRIIDYTNGPLNRIDYLYDLSGELIMETQYFKGKEYISRVWRNGKIHCQSIAPLFNGTFESFCFNEDGYFLFYAIIEKNDTSFTYKKYSYSSIEIESFLISYQDIGCTEILEVNFYPGFVISRSEYIQDCIFEINSFEANYYYSLGLKSTGQFSYPSKNILREKSDRTKTGEWKYYDLDNMVKKIVKYDEKGIEIECKGDCN
jgi:hypothetical protein